MADVPNVGLDAAQDAIVKPSFTVASCTTTNGSAQVTASSFAGVEVGDTVTGTGIPGSTTVTEVGSGTITISNNATASGTVTLTFATTYYLGLNTGDPGQSGADEGGDGRQAITFGASSSGSMVSTNSQTWSSAAGGYTYTYFSVWTASSGGTYVRGGQLTSSITPSTGSQIIVSTGGITFTAS